MKKLILTSLFLIGLFGFCNSSKAAIAFDATSTGAGTLDFTFNHTITGSNNIIFCGTSGNSNVATDHVKALDYNNVSSTKIGSVINGGGSSHEDLFYLLNPSTGTNSVKVHTDGGSAEDVLCTSYNGVDQTQTNIGSGAVSSTVTGTTLSITATSTVNNSWAVMWTCNNSDANPQAGANTTRLARPTGGWSTGQVYMFQNSAPISPAGTFTLNMTYANGSSDGIVAFFAPVVSAPPLTLPKMQIIWWE